MSLVEFNGDVDCEDDQVKEFAQQLSDKQFLSLLASTACATVNDPSDYNNAQLILLCVQSALLLLRIISKVDFSICMSQSEVTSFQSSILEKLFLALDAPLEFGDDCKLVSLLKAKSIAMESLVEMISQASEQDEDMKSDIVDQINNNLSDDELAGETYELNELDESRNSYNSDSSCTLSRGRESIRMKQEPPSDCPPMNEIYSVSSISGKDDSRNKLINESETQLTRLCSLLTRGHSTSGLMHRITSQLRLAEPVILYVLSSSPLGDQGRSKDIEPSRMTATLSDANMEGKNVDSTYTGDGTKAFNGNVMKLETQMEVVLMEGEEREPLLEDLNKRKRKQSHLESNLSCPVTMSPGTSTCSNGNESARKKKKNKSRRKKKSGNEGDSQVASSASELPLCRACMNDGLKKNSIIDHLLWMEMSCLISITNIAPIENLMRKDDAETASKSIFNSILNGEALLLHQRVIQSKCQFGHKSQYQEAVRQTAKDLHKSVNKEENFVCSKHKIVNSNSEDVTHCKMSQMTTQFSPDSSDSNGRSEKGKNKKTKASQVKSKHKAVQDEMKDGQNNCQDSVGCTEIELLCYAISAIRSLIDQKLISLSLDQVKLFDSFIKDESFLHKTSLAQCDSKGSLTYSNNNEENNCTLNEEEQVRLQEQVDWLKILSIKILGSFASQSGDLFILSSICKLLLGLLEEESFVTSASLGSSDGKKRKKNSDDLRLTRRNLRIRCELIDNLIDMFSSDGEIDSIIRSNNLLERFSVQEKILSEQVASFNSAKRQLNQMKFKNCKKLNEKFESLCPFAMSQSDEAVVQTVLINFKRFIRYKARMLKKM